jgi:hypothetical protein
MRALGTAFLAVAVAGTVLTSACGTEASPTPPVPEIDNAKDVRGQDPCTLLTGEQLAEVGLAGPGTPAPAAEGPRCAWRGAAGTSLIVTLYTAGEGLTTLAENSEPTTSRVRLAGYPALETFTAGGRFCQYDVGVAPGQVVMAALENVPPDSCTALQALLPDVLAGLPPASS